MDVIAFRLHTYHSVAVPPGCAVFVRGGAVAWQTRQSDVLVDPNHALLVPCSEQPSALTAIDAPASLTLICAPRIDLGAQPSVRLIDSAAYLEHFCITLSARDMDAASRLDRLVQSLRERAAEKPAASSAHSPSYGRIMQQYVTSSLAYPFKLADVASAAALSPFTASRVFHRESGVPLRVYTRRLRVRTALASIAERRNLVNVAMQLGFADHAHFSNAFRAEFGMTPSDWRDFACTKLYKTA